MAPSWHQPHDALKCGPSRDNVKFLVQNHYLLSHFPIYDARKFNRDDGAAKPGKQFPAEGSVSWKIEFT